MTNFLSNTDEIEQLLIDFGQASAIEEQVNRKTQMVEELIGSVYTDKIPEKMDFPSGTPLLVALITLHRKTDDQDVLDHIEREVLAVRYKSIAVAGFELQPFPYASYSELLAYADRFKYQKSVARYFRLRAFAKLGAFDEKDYLRSRESEGSAIVGLTEEEYDYLETM